MIWHAARELCISRGCKPDEPASGLYSTTNHEMAYRKLKLKMVAGRMLNPVENAALEKAQEI